MAVMVELLDVVDKSRVSVYDMELEETEEYGRLARLFRKDRHAVMTGLCRIAMENDSVPHCFAAWSLAANLARGADSDIRNILWNLSVRMLESHPMPGVRDRVVCNLPVEFPKPVLLELFRSRLRGETDAQVRERLSHFIVVFESARKFNVDHTFDELVSCLEWPFSDDCHRHQMMGEHLDACVGMSGREKTAAFMEFVRGHPLTSNAKRKWLDWISVRLGDAG